MKQKYINCIGDEPTREQLNLLELKISDCANQSDVQSCVSDFANIIYKVSLPLFKKPIKHDNKNKKTSISNNIPCYNEACNDKKY